MHSWDSIANIGRNIATSVGDFIAYPFGSGQPYKIEYYNKPTVWNP